VDGYPFASAGAQRDGSESADALVDAFTAFDRDADAAVAVLWGEGGAFAPAGI